MKDENYINIQGWMITKLGLTGNELILFAVIYGFSQDGKSKYRGSLSYIENALQISRNTIISNLAKLEKAKFVKKSHDINGNLYSANIELVQKLVVQKLNPLSAETAPEVVQKLNWGSAETEHNNNNNIYNNNNKDNNTSDDVAYVIKLFEKLDVKNKKYYANKTQRLNAKVLIDEYGIDRVEKVIDVYIKVRGDKFAPSISSPYDMVEKWSKLEDFFLRKKSDLKSFREKVIF